MLFSIHHIGHEKKSLSGERVQRVQSGFKKKEEETASCGFAAA